MPSYFSFPRKRNRAANFDYSSGKFYFVTTNVKWRYFKFGEVSGGRMYLNQYGEIVKSQWIWLLKQYPYLNCYAFMIMPDHIHAVIEINANYYKDKSIKIKSLSEVIGAFKMRVSKDIHAAGAFEFKWHRSFHDRIIRSANQFENCVNYTLNNPRNYKSKSYLHRPARI